MDEMNQILHGLAIPVYPEGPEGLEPIPADSGREAWYILERVPVYHRADTKRQTTLKPII